MLKKRRKSQERLERQMKTKTETIVEEEEEEEEGDVASKPKIPVRPIPLLKERSLAGHFTGQSVDGDGRMSWTSKRPGGRVPCDDLRVSREVLRYLPEAIEEMTEGEESDQGGADEE